MSFGDGLAQQHGARSDDSQRFKTISELAENTRTGSILAPRYAGNQQNFRSSRTLPENRQSALQPTTGIPPFLAIENQELLSKPGRKGEIQFARPE